MKNKIIILLTVVSALTVSCGKWLDVKPRTEKTAKALFESYQGYKDALTGCYMKLNQRSLYGEKLTMTTVEYLAQHWDLGDGHYGTVSTSLKKWDYKDESVKGEFLSIYSSLYNVIIQTNSILEAMPKTGAQVIDNVDTRNIIEGEALAIRALCHFEVLRIFGQLPNSSGKAVSLPYSYDVSKQAVNYYDYKSFITNLENDLLKAEKLMEKDPLVIYDLNTVNGLGQNYEAVTDDFLRYRNIRLNYWAVKGLQARFYLYTGQKSKAYEAAMVVINAKNADGKAKFSLMKATEKMLLTTMPEETLFHVNCSSLAEYIPILFNPNNNTDLNHYMSPDKLGSSYMYGMTVSQSTNSRYRYLWDHEFQDMWGKKSPLLLKYDQYNVKPTLSAVHRLAFKEVIPVIRLSEIYLIAMEASGDLGTINTLYETYRRTRDILPTTFTSELDAMDMIIKEYRCELIGEGQMFFTYKRTNAKTMPWTENPATVVSEDNYIVPLPATEFNPNK